MIKLKRINILFINPVEWALNFLTDFYLNYTYFCKKRIPK